MNSTDYNSIHLLMHNIHILAPRLSCSVGFSQCVYYPFQSQVLGAGAYQSYIWAKVQPWVTSSSQGPMLELGGPVPCSTLPQRCSEGILALPPTAITFSMFCCASSPWTTFVSPVHRAENDYNVFCAKQKSQYQSMWNWMNLATE